MGGESGVGFLRVARDIAVPGGRDGGEPRIRDLVRPAALPFEVEQHVSTTPPPMPADRRPPMTGARQRPKPAGYSARRARPAAPSRAASTPDRRPAGPPR